MEKDRIMDTEIEESYLKRKREKIINKKKNCQTIINKICKNYDSKINSEYKYKNKIDFLRNKTMNKN